MERLRTSLLQIPSSLLPSSRAPGLPDSDSQDSLEEGLTLRPVTAYGRSTSGPAVATGGTTSPQGPGGAPQRSVTFPAGGKAAAPAVAVRVDATSAGGRPELIPDAAAAPAAALQRVGSRQPSHGSGSSGSSAAGETVTITPAATTTAASEQSVELASTPSAGQGAFSPQPASERYSEEFEADDDSRSQAPTASPGGASGSSPGRSERKPVARPASAAVGRSGSVLSPARSPAARQLSRSSSARPGYLASTATMEAKRGTPTASAPGSRPASASPSKQPARCGMGVMWRSLPCTIHCAAACLYSRPASVTLSVLLPFPICRPSSAGRPLLEARVARQFEKDPADWTVGWAGIRWRGAVLYVACRQRCPSALLWLARFPATACCPRCHTTKLLRQLFPVCPACEPPGAGGL